MSANYKYTYKSADELSAAAEKEGVKIPLSSDRLPLSRHVRIRGIETTNSLAVHPMEGFDGNDDGSPSELTVRRYERFSGGGAGLFWFEATAVCREGRSSAHQLWINDGNLDSYKRLVEMMHVRSGGAPVICQLTHSGRFSKPDNVPAPLIAYHNPILNEKMMVDPSVPVVTDSYLDRLHEAYLHAAYLAKMAGFDGVDIKSCHRYLMSELLSAYTRDGKYGGDFDGRTRLLREVVSDVSSLYGDDRFLTCTRMSVSDCIPYPYGFCTDENGNVDLTEAKRLLRILMMSGLSILYLSMGTPYYNPHITSPYDSGGYEPPESPLRGVARMISAANEIKTEVQGIYVIGTGYSYLRALGADAASGVLSAGMADLVGFGRMAFAYPDFARDMMSGRFDSKKSCIGCGKCVQLMRRLTTAGCPVRDKMYTPIYVEACGGKENLF